MTQRDALNILKTGKNVFITGPAGSGKTFVVNEYIKYLKSHEVSIGITASTGIAATHMGGITIHSWSGIGIKDYLTEDDLEHIQQKSSARKKIEEAKVLIIDEVSMLHHFRLDLVERVLRFVKKNEEPFGGIQIVLCGDFFQLPPISRMGEQEALFVYHSDAWKAGNFAVCYLSENYRQTDDGILSVLNEIRSGEVSDEGRELLKGRYLRKGPKSAWSAEPVDEGETIPTRLYTHNADVDSVNDTEFDKVEGIECVYEMASRGKKPLVETLKKSCLAPEFLRLKKGARVMCVKNNFEKGYVNGTLGVVVSCSPSGVVTKNGSYQANPVIRTAPTPDFPEGRLVTIEPATWSIEDEGKMLAEIIQYPLRLAWAITVHKSQGMSLDAVEVDLSRSFEPGMGYVALSRVRTLNGLRILGINENALKVHPDVLEYDTHLKNLSAKAESVISHTDEVQIKKAHDEFLAEVAPMYSMKGKGAKGKRNIKKESTYEKTAQLILDKKSLKEIAVERDMTIDTIISHIEYLVATPEESEDEHLKLSSIVHLKYEISPQHFKKIENALEEVDIKQDDGKPPMLSPVKTKVGATISFKDIRLARVLLGYFNK